MKSIFGNKKRVNPEETKTEIKRREEQTKLQKLYSFNMLPVGILVVLSLASGIFFSWNYSSQLDENRQKTSYVADLKQMSERIEKSALQARSGSAIAFNELKDSGQKIDVLLNVLKSGGKINRSDSEINPIVPSVSRQFNSVVQEWSQNKPLLDALLSQENNIIGLRNSVVEERKNIQNILDLSINFQKLVQSSNLNTVSNNYAQELVLLSIRINQGTSELFSSETFSLENGYVLVKDLRQFNNIVDIFLQGSTVYGVNRITNPALVGVLNNIKTSFVPFQKLAEAIALQVATLNNAKDVALQVSNSSKNLTATAEELDQAFNHEISSLAIFRTLNILFFIIATVLLSILAFVFKYRSDKAISSDKFKNKNSELQRAVNLLIDQIKPMLSGDFTKRVYVSDRFVKQISDHVDYTRENFSNIVKKIKTTSNIIGKSAQQTDETSKELLEVTNLQFSQMELSINKLGAITSEMDEVAQMTWVAEQESIESQSASQEGENLVKLSMAKMNEIRENIQESAKKIKKSSESAQDITEVIGIILNIVKQIEILALNASIQAANSGEEGKEFGIVAQEVQRLAYDSKEATDQILILVREVKEDIATAVTSMEKTTQEVVEGARLTDEAGSSLKKIGNLSKQVATRVSEASKKLEEKSEDLVKVSLDMKELQNTTKNSKEMVGVSANQVLELKKAAEGLTNTIKNYKVDR